MQIVVVDLGGTHARFALAELHNNCRPSLGKPRRYRAADYPGLAAAWRAFSSDEGGQLPRTASIAVAGPADGEIIQFTNNHWTICPGDLAKDLELDDNPLLLNDFAAMASAVATLRDEELAFIGGPQGRLVDDGVTTVVGPGTGLGVAQLLWGRARSTILATEGGHIGFSPTSEFELKFARRLIDKHGRVSVERVVGGPALSLMREVVAEGAGAAIAARDDATVWAEAIDRSDPYAALALGHYVEALGAITGDLALAHGASSVVLAGGLATRIADRLEAPQFNERFKAKGRLTKLMDRIPIRLAVHPDPGLLGAAVAYQNARPR